MGINDPIKLEEKLALIAPRAYRHCLPAGFAPSLIIYDLNALQMSAFASFSNKCGYDYVNALNRPIAYLAQSPLPGEEAPLAVELGETAPSDEVLSDWREQNPEVFDYRAASSHAVMVYCRDDKQFMPRNRDLVHEKRYDGKPTLSLQDIRQQGIQIFEDRPLPGYTSNLEPKEDGKNLRTIAVHTPHVKRAYQAYGTWALCESITKITREMSAETMSRMTHRRRVLIDAVLEDFPIDLYRHTPLADLPDHWQDGKRVMRCFSLTTDEEHSTLPPPALGEADLKMVWYAQALAKPGEEVLIRTNDTDVVYILLLHARRFIDQNITVYVDANAHNMKSERYARRFICINELYRAITLHGEAKWEGMQNAAEVIVFLAILCGTDYTSNPYRIGTGTIVGQFFDKEGWKDMQNLLSRDTAQWEGATFKELGLPDDDETRDEVARVVVFSIDAENALELLRRLYQTRVTQATRKKYHVPADMPIKWTELEIYLKEQSDGKDPRLALPPMTEITADIGRSSWLLHYWGNAHLARGAFPSCELEDGETGASIWGWRLVWSDHTQGTGETRFVKPLVVENPARLLMEHRRRCASEDKEAKRLVIAKARSVAHPNQVRNWTLAEWASRCHKGKELVAFRFPLWSD